MLVLFNARLLLQKQTYMYFDQVALSSQNFQNCTLGKLTPVMYCIYHVHVVKSMCKSNRIKAVRIPCCVFFLHFSCMLKILEDGIVLHDYFSGVSQCMP